MTEAIVFRHFATKQELYTAILEARLKDADISARGWRKAQGFMDRRDDEGTRPFSGYRRSSNTYQEGSALRIDWRFFAALRGTGTGGDASPDRPTDHEGFHRLHRTTANEPVRCEKVIPR